MDIDERLAELRVEWTKYPKRREAIELQAKVLHLAKRAKSDYITPDQKQDAKLLDDIVKTLF